MATGSTRDWVGHTVLDRDGEQVGKVGQLYRDQDTDRRPGPS